MKVAPLREADDYERVSQILDELPVIDKVFTDLRHTRPLVTELLQRVRALRPSGRVLIIAPNITLPKALIDLGYRVDLWHVIGGTLNDELQQFVSRTGSIDNLVSTQTTEAVYDIVVLPYVLEACNSSPTEVLANLRNWLLPGGAMVVAYRQAGGLGNRMRGLAGLPVLSDRRQPMSFSWPPLPERRSLGLSDIDVWALATGFRLVKRACVVDKHGIVPSNAMTVRGWLLAEVAHGLKRSVPNFRDCVVGTLQSQAVEPPHTSRKASGSTEEPLVSVIAPVRDQSGAMGLLEGLAQQTYPPERLEIVLLHRLGELDPSAIPTIPKVKMRFVCCESPEGPEAANRAIALASGDILALTDDRSRVPPGWVEAGVAGLSNWTVALTGHVLLSDGPAALVGLPGTRPSEGDHGLFPAANSFYVKEAVAQVGGFTRINGSKATVPWGWDSTVASRLRRLGYRVAFNDTLYVFRSFRPPTGRQWVRQEYRSAQEMPAAVHELPDVGQRLLRYGVFATSRTLWFDVGLLGLALAAFRRRPIYLVLALPWLRGATHFFDVWPPSGWKPSVASMGGMVARQFVWLAGLTVGSIKARRPVL
ncbi:MAG: hypothetical protein M3082_20255 [Candidatus Dormibacteraeota bacterium]|nr:hypothetical protein [Candidatus Dormibacteraeota bacterium]